jgi:peptidoglycan/LPS O-acetylase OafA/YrhL
MQAFGSQVFQMPAETDLNQRKRRNLPPLTSLRFFAASGVVIFHYNLTSPIFPSGLAGFGYEAVTFFFVLSGFILAYAPMEFPMEK